MKNVDAKVVSNKLVLTVDLSKDFGPSHSGKTTVIGTTEGFVKIEGKEGYAFGLNVVRK